MDDLKKRLSNLRPAIDDLAVKQLETKRRLRDLAKPPLGTPIKERIKKAGVGNFLKRAGAYATIVQGAQDAFDIAKAAIDYYESQQWEELENCSSFSSGQQIELDDFIKDNELDDFIKDNES